MDVEQASGDIGAPVGPRRRRVRRRLIAGVAAAAVVLGGGTYAAVRLASSNGLSTSGLTTLWTQQAPAVNCAGDAGPGPSGLLTAGGLAVGCFQNGSVGLYLAAYQVQTGRVAWTWRASPGLVDNRTVAEAMLSDSADDGISVFYYDTLGNGAFVIGLNVTNGRMLWRRPASIPGGDPILEGDGRVVLITDLAPGQAGHLQVYSLASGALDWSATARDIPPAGCSVEQDAIAGPWVYAVTKCSGQPDELYQMSLQTGAVIARAPLGSCQVKFSDDNHSTTLMAAGGYLLAGCDADTSGAQDVVIVRAGGVRQVPMTSPYPLSNVYVRNLLDDQVSDAVSGSTLYLGEDYAPDGDPEAYGIAAIDLGTARLRWYKSISVPGESPGDPTFFPLNVVGAGPGGVIDLIEMGGGPGGGATGMGSTGMTLAIMSASDGSMSYGPGATYSDGDDSQPPSVTLAGKVLLSFAAACGTFDTCRGLTDSAYSLGSWPG